MNNLIMLITDNFTYNNTVVISVTIWQVSRDHQNQYVIHNCQFIVSPGDCHLTGEI